MKPAISNPMLNLALAIALLFQAAPFAAKAAELPADCKEMEPYFQKLGSFQSNLSRFKTTNPDVQLVHRWLSDHFVRIISLSRNESARAQYELGRFKTCARLTRSDAMVKAFGKSIPASVEREQDKYEFTYLTQYFAYSLSKVTGGREELSEFTKPLDRGTNIFHTGLLAMTGPLSGLMAYTQGAGAVAATVKGGAAAVVGGTIYGTVVGGFFAAVAGMAVGDVFNYADEVAGNPVKTKVTRFLQQHIFGGPSENRQMRESADTMATLVISAHKSFLASSQQK